MGEIKGLFRLLYLMAYQPVLRKVYSFLWVWVWVSSSQRIPLSFLREIHTKGLRARFLTRPEEDEGKQDPRAVNRSRGKATVRERRLLREELGPVDTKARSANVRG